MNSDLKISLMNIIERDNVFLFSNDGNSSVFEELKRSQISISRSLSDFFIYGNTMNRSLNDIIYFEILNEHEKDE